MAEEFRTKLRHFLLFSDYYTEETALAQFGDSELFKVETLLTGVNVRKTKKILFGWYSDCLTN